MKLIAKLAVKSVFKVIDPNGFDNTFEVINNIRF